MQVITLDGRLIYSTRTFKFLTDLSGTSIFKNIQPGSGFFMGRSGGKEILYSYARSHVYRGFKGLGWILVLGHDSNEILAPVLSLKRRILASSLILIGVALFIVFFMSRSITNPVRELTKGSNEIARGRLDYRIPVRGKDELVQLGDAFNDMADQRIRHEQTLKESEDRLRTIFDSTETGIFLIDPESHTIVDANRAALDMTGGPMKEIVGSVCHRYICPAEEGRCPVTDLGERVDRSERLLLKADGDSIPILKTVTPVLLNGRKHSIGEFRGYLRTQTGGEDAQGE